MTVLDGTEWQLKNTFSMILVANTVVVSILDLVLDKSRYKNLDNNILVFWCMLHNCMIFGTLVVGISATSSKVCGTLNIFLLFIVTEVRAGDFMYQFRTVAC